MKNNKRGKRLDFILRILNESQQGISVSDVHKRLIEEYQLDVSRKTIEREFAEIVKTGLFFFDSKSPQIIYPCGIHEGIIHLTNEDVTYLLVVLPGGHPLRERLKNLFAIDRFCLDHK